MDDVVHSLVRTKDGKYGRISDAAKDLSWLELEWVLPLSITPKKRKYTVKEILSEDLEVMTEDSGWDRAQNLLVRTEAVVPLGLMNELKKILDEDKLKRVKRSVAHQRQVSGDHDPFKYRDTLGKGPLQKVKRKKNKYDCRCRNYKCRCAGPKGKTKLVQIDRSYRRWYNRAFLDDLQGRSTQALRVLRKRSARRRRQSKTD